MADAGAAITVAIVDDQALFRAGIRMLVESQPDMAMSWEAGDGAQAAAFAVDRCPDVMLMDLRMPVLDGVGATRRIVQQAGTAGTDAPKIIALTTFNRDQAVWTPCTPGPAATCSRAPNRRSCSPRSAPCTRATP